MSYLNLLRDSIASVFTPRKFIDNQKKSRDRVLMPPPVMTRPLNLDTNVMTPTSKTREWLAQSSPSPTSNSFSTASPKTPSVLGANTEGAKISKKYPAPKRARLGSTHENHRPEADDEYDEDSDDDLDGPTLVNQDLPRETERPRASATPISTIKKNTRAEETYQPGQDDDEEEEEVQIRIRPKHEVPTSFSMERARRFAETARLTPDQHWSKRERELFQHLALRGFEPLVPFNWALDFRTFPPPLFASKGQTSVIFSMFGSEFRAIHALQSLVRLGPIARDKIICLLRPERILRRTIKAYMAWVIADANLPKYPSSGIPVHSIVSLKPGQTKAETVQRLADKLHALAVEWREVYAVSESVEEAGPSTPSNVRRASAATANTLTSSAVELPILTGILIIHSLVAIVTLDPNEENVGEPATGQGQVRQIIVINFGHAPYDVWNAFAVAIVGMHLRKVRMDFENRVEGMD